MKNYHINPDYLCTVKRERPLHISEDIPFEDGSDIALSKGKPLIAISWEDHPEFLKLRDRMLQDKVIAPPFIPGVRNGDKVIEPFTFNGVEFEAGERFPSASAMPGRIKFHDL